MPFQGRVRDKYPQGISEHTMAEKLLFINACVRRERSRTLRLARKVAEQFPDHIIEELVLEEMNLKPLDSEFLDKRDALIASGDFDDPIFNLAKKFADADRIIVATPYWEDCFSSYVKIFMEHAAALGITFRYSPEGMPVGLCRAECLYYVTTRGGPIPDEADLGYSVYRTLCRTYGIKECRIVSASGLDIVGNDAEAIMERALDSVRDL